MGVIKYALKSYLILLGLFGSYGKEKKGKLRNILHYLVWKGGVENSKIIARLRVNYQSVAMIYLCLCVQFNVFVCGILAM